MKSGDIYKQDNVDGNILKGKKGIYDNYFELELLSCSDVFYI